MTTPLSGLTIWLERAVEVPCVACGATNVVCGSSSGLHLASLRCSGCGAHRGWLSKATGEFLLAAIARFGKPTTPIIVRNSAVTLGSTTAASSCT
jgi:hypothetical protein